MKRRTKKIIGVVVVVGAVAAGGAAYTAASSLPNTVAGYATSTISGATGNSITYDYDSSGVNIIGVDLVFNEDLTAAGPDTNGKAATVTSAFNASRMYDNCVVGAYDGPGAGKGTHVHCDWDGATGSDPGPAQDAKAAVAFHVAVTTSP